MKVYFSHGKESGPEGSKIQRLRAVATKLGMESESIDYRGMDDPEVRVGKLMQRLEEGNHQANSVVLVGSSMGAYVSARVLHDFPRAVFAGVFLLAPAVYMSGYESTAIIPPRDSAAADVPLSVVHGWNDDVVPWQNALRYAEQCSADLHLMADEHRLMGCLGQIEELFEQFLRSQLLV